MRILRLCKIIWVVFAYGLEEFLIPSRLGWLRSLLRGVLFFRPLSRSRP